MTRKPTRKAKVSRRLPRPVVVMAATASDRPRVTLDTLKGGERVWSLTVPGANVPSAIARAIEGAKRLDAWRKEAGLTADLERKLAAAVAAAGSGK